MNQLFFKCTTGEYNYGLNDVKTEMKMKAFYLPNFEDLFYKGDVEIKNISTINEIENMDARELSKVFLIGNPMYLEVLFANTYNAEPEVEKHLKELLSIRNEIAKMNLPGFLSHCLGIASTNMKLAARVSEFWDTDSSKKPGIKLAKAYRLLDLFKRYYKTEFSDFGKALFYNEDERQLLIDIKNEVIPYDEVLYMIQKEERTVSLFKTHLEQSHDIEYMFTVIEKIENILKSATRVSLLKNLEEM
ncbi:hypothetical protein bcgnr5378_05830 [Bacillus cereus]|uniref:Uncharacterized protein n=1 Tax=Bacillus cereus TaxID=1396 RepID=A0A162NW94_BACCE|nr:hypothetical protein [Bacillus cereus]KZD55643.1 hypothetical protein B4088_5388 [Bacillus cereus]